ncbi:hypothetical protein [Phytohabitans houttuyneae]|uniref:Uncharacterized protein n=1 Tax=Phytohabitans houttuyneae TaxID=1076126 RepID=A0A6V8KGY8_9ACTN|nr:hypothetical protein [Phytohabitans houttuyneae]GFJ81359.1 hypothetical protein Phou_055390 [Phytohabitans houttuyneae]
MTSTIGSLASVGNVVDEDYHHVTKAIVPRPALVLPDAYLKWYDLHREDQRVDPDVDLKAREFLRAEAATGRLPISGDLGFVIDHLSGEHIHLLLVFTWRSNNEMWESVYYMDVRDGEPFRLLPQGTHRGAICVWEFGAVAHEHLAWTRYLRSDRDEQAKRAYVESQFTGLI